jgi:hypothetical protein
LWWPTDQQFHQAAPLTFWFLKSRDDERDQGNTVILSSGDALLDLKTEQGLFYST